MNKLEKLSNLINSDFAKFLDKQEGVLKNYDSKFTSSIFYPQTIAWVFQSNDNLYRDNSFNMYDDLLVIYIDLIKPDAFCLHSNFCKWSDYYYDKELGIKGTIEDRINNLLKVANENYKIEHKRRYDKYIKEKKSKKKSAPNRGKELYLIINNDRKYLKIGVSVNTKDRIKNLQTSNPDKLSIMFALKNKSHLEKVLHKKFSHINKNGEWFDYSDEIVNEFKKLAKRS